MILSCLERHFRKDPDRAARSLSQVSKRTLRRIQTIKLHRLLNHSYQNSEFYRKRLKKSGLRLSRVTLENVRDLPFITPEDLLEGSEKFFCLPPREMVHLFTSSGTTGRPKKIYFSKEDLSREIEAIAIGLVLGGVRKATAVQIMFSFGRPSWAVGYLLQRAVETAGALAIPSSDTLSPEEQVKMMREYHVQVLMGTPSYIHRLTEEASKSYQLNRLGIRSIFLAAEPWPSDFRKMLEEAWRAKVYDGYGLAEMGFGLAMECREQKGLHFDEADFLVEVIDPKTGEILPDGQEGEIVLTTLSRGGMPLIRYRSHDISCIMLGDCQCGLPLRRIGRIKGRTDEMVIIGSGENLYPTSFDKALFAPPQVSDYQLILEKDNYKEKIILKVEVSERSDRLRERIKEAIYQVSTIKKDIEETGCISEPEIILLEPGSLPKSGPKSRRIIDRRQLYPS